jgi:probable HAF family extracellular repeat protein
MVEKDENGNWVSPGYVYAPGVGYQELPWVASRNTDANGINDLGMIVGDYAIADASSTSGLKYVGGLWQLNPDGTISDPVSLGDFRPWKINHAGVIAGHYQGNPAIAWYQGDVLMMKQLVGSSRFFAADVHAMNDFAIDDPRLTLVGTSTFNEAGEYNAGDSRRGYAWRPFDTTNPATVLGTLGGNESNALDVNRHGEIVGYSDTRRKGQQAFHYKGGVPKSADRDALAGRSPEPGNRHSGFELPR